MVEKVILKVVAETSKASKDMNALGNETKGAAAQTTLLGGAMNMVRGAMLKVKAMSKLLFGSIKAGLISTGIGAFLVIIGSLISYFTSTKKGAEMLERVFAGVGAAIAVITDRISQIGGAIVKVFSGDWAGAVDDIKGSMTGIGDEMAREYNQAMNLKRIFQEIADTEREFNKERAQTNQEIAKAQMIAEDDSKNLEERVEALQRANELELTTTTKALDLQLQKTEAKRQEVALGESLAEDLDALAAEEIKLIEMQTRSFKIRKKLAVAVETLRVEARAKQKARADARKKELKEIADAELKLNNETTANQQELYYRQLKTKEEVELAKLYTAMQKKEKEIEHSKAGELAKFQALGVMMQKYEDDKQIIVDKYNDLNIEKTKAQAKRLKDLQNENILLSTEEAIERANLELEMQRTNELNSVGEVENAEALKAAINEKYNLKKQAQNKATSDAERKLGVGDLGAAAGLIGGMADMEQEGTKKWKQMKIAEARINSFVAAQAAFSSMAAIPIVGTAMGTIAAMLALHQGQKQVDAINATEIPKMARGGVVGGHGSGTSDSVNAKLSKGEVVINAKSAKMFRGALSNMNVAGGGVGFARGGATTPGEGAGFNGFSNEPLKAFVLSDEMTSSQDRASKIKRRSSI